MKKFAVSLATVAFVFLGAADGQAQDKTVATWTGSWTPIGQLAAGQHHPAKDAMKVTFAVRLATNNPSGTILVPGPGGQETRHPMEMLKVYDSDDAPPVDYFTFAWEMRPDYWVSCTLANREPTRFSGLCWDNSQNEGWMEMVRSQQ
jgi:hypothetical protein